LKRLKAAKKLRRFYAAIAAALQAMGFLVKVSALQTAAIKISRMDLSHLWL